MEIVSGRTGKPHVTSQQFRQMIEGTIGQESCIITSGENLEPELAANNLLKIRSGMMSHHGNVSSVNIGTYDEVEFTNGSQGMKRIDLVVNRYTRNAETNIEKNEWVVIMGTPVASNPVAPTYTVGNLQKGDLVDDCPVFELHYDGINVTEVKKLLSVLPNVAELNSKSIKNFISPDVDAEKLGCVEFSNGLKIVFGSVKCNYANPNVLSGDAKFPVVFSQAPCFTTGVGNIGNTYDELSRNAKVEIHTTSINIALHDPSSNFSAGTYYYVNFIAIGV